MTAREDQRVGAGFITLRELAESLAGEGPDGGGYEHWLAMLEANADAMLVVRAWVTSRSALPGGLSYQRPPEDWRVPRARAEAWLAQQGLVPPRLTAAKAPAAVSGQPSPTLAARTKAPDRGAEEIRAALVAAGLDPMALPAYVNGRADPSRAVARAALPKMAASAFKRAWDALPKAYKSST